MASFEQRPNGTWSVRFRDYDEKGKEHYNRLSGYKTKREARQAYEEYLRSHAIQQKREPTPADDFRDLVVLFLRQQKNRWKESSYLDAEGKISNHILPYFADTPTQEITPQMIEDWQNELIDAGYKYRYRKNIRAYLASMFKLANRKYKIPNPMLEVEPLRNLEAQKEMQIWSPEEMNCFLAQAEKYPIFHAFFKFLYFSGCRRGEALALTRQDIDPRKQYVRINKNLSFKTKGKTFAITTPKNQASNRSIYLPKDLIDELLALPANKFLFGVDDKPLSENTVYRKFKKISEQAGIKQIRIHDLRHSCASLLISKGVPITAVSKRLGHSSIEQTLNTYAHLLPSDEDKIKKALDGL